MNSSTEPWAPHVVRNPPVDRALEEALVDLWVRVTDAGGAVGFLAPTSHAHVEPLARAELERVREGLDDLVVAFAGEQPLAFGFLSPERAEVVAHRGTIKRLQRDPKARDRGLGAAVLAELERAGWERGLRRLCLTVRAGTGREAFYVGQGWNLDARLPGRLVDAGGAEVDELHLSRRRPEDAGADPLAGSWQMSGPTVPVHRLDPDVALPAYAHPGDAGLDLHAAEDVHLAPGDRVVVPTGLALAIPEGFVGLVHPRSGLAVRHGLALVNAPGTIDAGYRGEIKVVVVNLDPRQEASLARGDRVAQLVVQPVARVSVVEVDELPQDDDGVRRGAAGFGSTGR